MALGYGLPHTQASIYLCVICQVSQHDLIHIYEDKLFRQQGIGQRLVRAPISEATLDAQIGGDSPLTAACLELSLMGHMRQLAALE